MIGICAASRDHLERARQLSEALHLPLLEPAPNDHELALLVDDEGLALWAPGRREHPVRCDFTSGKMTYRRRQGGGRQQALARAAGLHQGGHPVIVDATGGLGRDAFVFASLGCEVIILERHPIIAALLEDGMRRARAGGGETARVIDRLQLHHTDADHWLAQRQPLTADIIYLDPMYPERRKRALGGLEMRYLRTLAGDDADAGHLLARALQCDVRRVVVKRPRLAPQLGGPAPGHVVKASSTRYDVYFPQTLQAQPPDLTQERADADGA